MSFVIPKWRVHAVINWNDLLIKSEEGEFDLNPATVAVLNYMPVIGITTLTSENASDAWCRIAIYQALIGSFFRPIELSNHSFYACLSYADTLMPRPRLMI
jgi:hypothetical protein